MQEHLKVGCAECGRTFADGEETYGLWVKASYDCWGVVVCKECRDKYPGGIKDMTK